MQAYLDNSATTRPTDGVIDAMARAMREDFYNPSSLYAPAMIPEKQMNLCRVCPCSSFTENRTAVGT